MKAMTLLWAGSILIISSIVLQATGLLLPSLAITMIGLALNAVSVPFTIVQAYRSALEQQQLFEQERKARDAADQRVFSETPKGRALGALSQMRTEMHIDSQDPHR